MFSVTPIFSCMRQAEGWTAGVKADLSSRDYYHVLKALLDDGASVDVASVCSVSLWFGWGV